jgi:hypothetical protein
MRGAPSTQPGTPIFDHREPSTSLLTLLAAPRAPRVHLLAALRALPPSEIAPLLDRLALHRIDGLAHRTLATLPEAAVHPWLRASLRRRHQRCAAVTLTQGLILAEALEALHQARVPVVVMRGLRTLEGVYGDPGARPFEDHDLMVLPGDIGSARRVLARIGFRAETPCLHRRGGMLIDLHSDPQGALRRPTRQALFPIATEGLFERATPGMVAGAPALLLSAEDDLLLMALHLVKHSFDRLVRVADIAHLVSMRASVLDWRRLQQRSVSWRIERVMGWALEAASRLGAPIPPDLQAGCAPGRVESSLESLLMRRALELRPLPYCGELLMALASPSWRQRVLFLMDALLPAGEYTEEGWGRVAALPRRTHDLLQHAASRATMRRKAR